VKNILGIDLGTTNSLVSWWRAGNHQLARNPAGSVLTPSAVSLDDSGEVLVGDAALDRLVTHPEQSAAVFKRRMGSSGAFQLGERKFRAEELSSLVLRQLVRDAEHEFGETFTQAVISVPAYFNDSQRKATRIAGELAGLNVQRLINEPTAAAMAYGLHEDADEQTILVVDLGGGTLDVSVLEFFDGVMEVHASTGDNYLGGEDFDTVLRQWILEQWNLSEDKLDGTLKASIRRVVTRCRHALSAAASTTVSPPEGLPKSAKDLEVSREQFETLTTPLLQKLRKTIERAVRDSRMSIKDLSQVVLVGGATRMPVVRNLVGRLFQRIPLSTLNPDEVVAVGASVQAALEAKDAALQDKVLTDVCPYSLGVQVASDNNDTERDEGRFLPIIERNTTIPVSRVETLYPVHEKQQEVWCRVFQGESRLTSNNVKLGELTIKLPRRSGAADAREEGIDVRFTYDTNGILEVDATLRSSKKTETVVLRLSDATLSDEDVAKRLHELAALKVHPRDAQQNIALLARAHRLYEERLAEEREQVARAIDQFEQILSSQDPQAVESAQKQFASFLEELEKDIF